MSPNPDPGQAEGVADSSRFAWAAVLLAALVLAAYGPTLSHGFVWDDHEQVVDNPHLRHWSSLPELWRHDVLTLSRADGESRSNYYRPLFFTQYLLYYQLFGLDTAAWHGVALLQHWLACFAALIFLRALGLRWRLAVAAACLFAVHPAHGESVSWVAAAFNDPPAATLLLLALAAHVRWRRGGSFAWIAGSALLYAGALALKEAALSMLLLVPLVDAALDRGPGRRWKPWPRLLTVFPFWILLGGNFLLESKAPWPVFAEHPFLVLPGQLMATLGLAALALQGIRKSIPRQFPSHPFASYAPYLAVTLLYFAARKAAIFTLLGVYPGDRTPFDLIPSLPSLMLFYLKALVWPLGLAPSYPLRLHSGWNAAAVAQGLGLAAILGLLLWASRRFPKVAFAALWTAACTLPALNVLSFRPQYLVHQRYLYLAALGVCCLAAWAVYRWLPSRPGQLLALAGLLGMGVASNLYHNRFWASDQALWTRVAQVDPANPASFDWLGNQALQEGRVDQAERLFGQSLESAPAAPYGLCNLGTLLYTHRRDPTRALPYLERGAEAFAAPHYPSTLEAAFSCRLNLANAKAQTGNPEAAISDLHTLFLEPPHRPEAARNLAVLLLRQRRLGEVETVLREAIRLHPEQEVLQTMLRDVGRWRASKGAEP